ncbi:LRR domain containing protein [Trema orientale]|uniref:LRR domain containing protein n=1 Tax=Trema orientale TaxID=63057 RepID=A0A2P5FUQ0_TREOI|nr:LRR domain containing protein [Trema orientale]
MYDCPRLESFLEWGSFSRLSHISISNCEKLFSVRVQWKLERFTYLEKLSLSFCNVGVDSFPEEDLLPTTLTSLYIYNCPNLKALNGKSLQQLSSLETLHFHDCKELQYLPEEGLPTSVRHLTIDDCPLLTERCQRESGEDWPKIAHISRIEIDGEHMHSRN